MDWVRPLYVLRSLGSQIPLQISVQVQCNVIKGGGGGTMEFPHSALDTPPFWMIENSTPLLWVCSETMNTKSNAYTGQNWVVDIEDIVKNRSLLGEALESSHIYFTWVDLSQYSLKPSIAAAIFIQNTSSAVGYDVAACSIDARWLQSELWIDPTLSEAIQQPYSKPVDQINALAGETLNAEPTEINLDWAGALNVNMPNQSIPISTIENLLLAGALNSTWINWLSGHEGVSLEQDYNWTFLGTHLAFIMADGLSRVGSGLNLTMARSSNAIDNINWTELNVGIIRYGYSYSMTTVTSKIAAAVLLLHATIALLAILALVINKYTSRSWTSVGEMLALAFNSDAAPSMQNTGAGIRRLRTWKERVGVRVDDGGKLKMVFEDEASLKKYELPRPGEMYG
jgi:hypothetical protein